MTCQDSFHEVAFNISFWTRNISSARILFWRGVFSCIVFINLYNEMSQDPPFHLKLKILLSHPVSPLLIIGGENIFLSKWYQKILLQWNATRPIFPLENFKLPPIATPEQNFLIKSGPPWIPWVRVSPFSIILTHFRDA